MDYASDMRIDETALDVEWLEQAELALKYGQHFAMCKKRLNIAEENVKVIRAELVAEANADPDGCCNKDKPNAADIEAYYRNDKRHKEAKRKWIEAQYELDMAEIAKNEISFTRKAALEGLGSLYISNYFAGPKVPRNLVDEVKKRKDQKQVNKEIGASINRTR